MNSSTVRLRASLSNRRRVARTTMVGLVDEKRERERFLLAKLWIHNDDGRINGSSLLEPSFYWLDKDQVCS
jgi:hypothetical protein